MMSSLVAAAIRPEAALAAGESQAAAPTVLRLVRRTIEVNGKPASVFGIRQSDGAEGITTHIGCVSKMRSASRA